MLSHRNSIPNREELVALGWRKIDDPCPIRALWQPGGDVVRFDDPLSNEYRTAPHEIEIWVDRGDPATAICLLVPRVEDRAY